MRPADGVPSAIDLERSHMRRRLWLSAVMAALGALLLVVAGFAQASSSQVAAKKGGTLRLNMSDTDLDFADPSLAYYVISWQVEAATGLKLLSYPDKAAPAGSRLIPEAAAAMPIVSNNGKTYTFTIRKGFRFSDGTPVTAKNFKWAIDRSATKAQQSPATPFMDDVVGYNAALNGNKNPAHVSGAIARGNKFILRLTHPDGGMLAKLAMPFFQALSLKTKVDPHGVTKYPSAGPYYISSYNVGRHLVLKKNKYYHGNRPANIDTFDIDINTDVNQSLLQVRSNQRDYDMGGLPPSAHADLAKRYGLNKGQYQVHPLVETDYIALNTSRPAFKSAKLRRAVNFAIDRPAMLRVRGAFGGKRTDQVLPPTMRGFKDAKIYPMKGADYPKAKRLAGSSCKAVTLYTTTTPIGQGLAQVFKYNLGQIGCNVTIKNFVGAAVYTAMGTKGEPFDAGVAGWNQDYPDPYDFLNILLDGNSIHAENNNNLAYLNVPKVNKLLEKANLKTGAARYKTYGALDINITKNYAPWASYDNRNEREFVSKRTGGYLFQPANASADLNTFFIK